MASSATEARRRARVGCGRTGAALNDAAWVDAPASEVLDAFAERDALRGRRLHWEGAGGDDSTGAGTGAGIDERGSLLVDADSGRRVALGAGEVQLALDR